MRLMQLIIASLLAIGAAGVVSAISLVVRDVLQVESDTDRRDPDEA